jgi:hypothetical protein
MIVDANTTAFLHKSSPGWSNMIMMSDSMSKTGTMRPIHAVLLAFIVNCAPLGVAAERAAVVFDFESGDLQGWQIVEGEFYRPIVDREFYVNYPKQKYNKQGKYYRKAVDLPPGGWGYIVLASHRRPASGQLPRRPRGRCLATHRGRSGQRTVGSVFEWEEAPETVR